jgi:hypothetical protein
MSLPPPSPGSERPPIPGARPSAPYPAYGQPYGQRWEHPNGTTILVLGILSLVTSCFILGPIAWSMGNRAIREMDANPGAWSNRGNVNAGRICGIISSCIAGLGAMVVLMVITAAILGQ